MILIEVFMISVRYPPLLYFVEVIHEKAGVIFKNSYKPLDSLDENNILARFEFVASWGDILRMGERIVDIIEEIKAKWSGYLIFSGSYRN